MRKPPIEIGGYYHVYCRGVEKRPVFLDFQDKIRFTKLLLVSNSDASVRLSNYKGVNLENLPMGKTITAVGAWALMENHLHLLLKEVSPGGISKFMQKLITAYTMYFNIKYDRKGVLFDGTFKSKHLNSDRYLKYIYSYIHLNPIALIDNGWKNKRLKDRKSAVVFVENYVFSSYLDLKNKNTRPEGKILNLDSFPNYFQTENDVSEMVSFWLNFNDQG